MMGNLVNSMEQVTQDLNATLTSLLDSTWSIQLDAISKKEWIENSEESNGYSLDDDSIDSYADRRG